ncbi:branched-chain amino acid transaminase [Acidobacteria bacterium AH-259-A15]|nr:branched-chain amino acid transaminase [Acidobacteria bacterium AH-259-A15]
MTDSKARNIWHNGEFVDWDEANIHVTSHALHYGTSWFEGIRCYKSSRGSEVFRLPEHINRLFNSCKIYRTEIPFSREEFQEATLETIRINEMVQCYIRPLIFRGSGSLGVNPLPAPIECFIMVWEWGSYLGDEALDAGVDVSVSSWFRAAPNTFPTMAKVGGNYINSALIKMEAVLKGHAEGVALDAYGFVSEGSGENIFLVSNGKLFTPPLSSAILPGITRDSVMALAKEGGYEVIEQSIPREMLYLADEIFLTGTAAEVTPIRSVDSLIVGEGKRGPITKQIQQDFFDYVEGNVEDRHGWMTPVYKEERVRSS